MATVKIGHASNPNSEAAKQVLISDYYSGSWTIVLRPRTREIAEKSAAICEAVCNNNSVRYSQSYRNTLRKAALDAAGLGDSDNNINKITVENIAAISKTCYADCSSLMTFCAIAGGARITYGSNAATTSTMRLRFTKYGDYKVYIDKAYTDSSKYLQRGDILVGGGHTVMVLGDGSDAVVVPSTEDERLDITTIKLEVALEHVGQTTCTASLRVYKLNVGAEELLESTAELEAYKWSYSVNSLTEKNDLSDSLKLKSGSNTISISELRPNHSYVLLVTATELSGKTELSSASVIFTTKPSYPAAITNLSVKFDESFFSTKSFSLTFSHPTDDVHIDTGFKTCYRLILFVNGTNVAHSDSVLSSARTYENKVIKLSQITSKTSLFTQNDIVQIGIQPGLKDLAGKFICEPAELRCSQPIVISGDLNIISKAYINIKDAFKRVLVYKKQEE